MNLGMLGLLGGIGQGISQAGAAWGAGMNEQAKEERSLINNQKLLEQRDNYEEAKRQRVAGQVKLIAQEFADERAAGQTGLLEANRQEADSLFPPGMASSGTEGASAVTPVKGKVTPMDTLLAVGQVDPMGHAGTVAKVVSEERMAAASAAKTAQQERETARKEERDRSDREVADKRLENEAKRLEKLIAKGGDGSDKKPAEIVATEWLIAHKDDPEALKTWEKVHTVKDKSVATLAADMVAKNPMLTVPEAYKKAAELVRLSGEAPASDATNKRASQFKVLR